MYVSSSYLDIIAHQVFDKLELNMKRAVSLKSNCTAGAATSSLPEPARGSSSTLVAHIFVSGKVQGVFYRKYTHAEGTRLGLQGWVRNLDDGRVEITAQGPKELLAQLVQWCHRGSPKSKVSDVAVTYSDALDSSLGPFTIQRGGSD